jgi:ketosteroid isomerase-like protein
MWTLKDAQEAIQAWFEELRKAYNENNGKRIGELYNDDSLIYARESGKTAKGRTQIKSFWKNFVKPRKGTWTKTEFADLTLIPTDRLVRDGLAFERIM